MITGCLSPDDCPDCGGPLLDTSTNARLLTLACPGCGYTATWHATDNDTSRPDHSAHTDPDAQEAE